MDHGCGGGALGKVTDWSLTWHESLSLSEPHFLTPLHTQSDWKTAYLSLQHQLLGEKRCFFTEGLSLLHQAWEVSGSSGAFNACVRRKGEFVMERSPDTSNEAGTGWECHHVWDKAEVVVEGQEFSSPRWENPTLSEQQQRRASGNCQGDPVSSKLDEQETHTHTHTPRREMSPHLMLFAPHLHKWLTPLNYTDIPSHSASREPF